MAFRRHSAGRSPHHLVRTRASSRAAKRAEAAAAGRALGRGYVCARVPRAVEGVGIPVALVRLHGC